MLCNIAVAITTTIEGVYSVQGETSCCPPSLVKTTEAALPYSKHLFDVHACLAMYTVVGPIAVVVCPQDSK